MFWKIILSAGIHVALTSAQFSLVGCIALGTFGSRLALLGPQITSPIMDVNFCQNACLIANTNFAAVYNGCVLFTPLYHAYCDCVV